MLDRRWRTRDPHFMSQSSRQSPVNLDTSRIQGDNSDSSARQTDSSSAAPSSRTTRPREYDNSSASSASLPSLAAWSQSLERSILQPRAEGVSGVAGPSHQPLPSTPSGLEGPRTNITARYGASTAEVLRPGYAPSSSNESRRPLYSELPPIESRSGESQHSFQSRGHEHSSINRHPPSYSESPGRPILQPLSSQVGHEDYGSGSRADAAMPQSPFRPALSVSTGVTNSDYRMMTFETESGNYSVPVDVRAASRVADEKRRRNAGASARFRARRKEREQQNTQDIETLRTQVHDLSEDAAFYRAERDFYRSIVQRGSDADRYLPRPTSPRLRRLSRTGSDYSSGPIQSPGTSTAYGFEEHGQRGAGGRYSRRRLSTPFESQRYPPGAGQSHGYVPPIPLSGHVPPSPSQWQHSNQHQSNFGSQFPPPASGHSQPDLPPRSYLTQRRSLPSPHVPPPPPPPPSSQPRPNLPPRSESAYEAAGRPPHLPLPPPPPPPPQR